MGIPSLRYPISLIAFKRLKYSQLNPFLLQINQNQVSSSDQINRFYKQHLYKTVDGKDLTESSKVRAAHRWVDDGSNLLTVRDYVKSIHLRYGVWFSRGRSARERSSDNTCRRGFQQPETIISYKLVIPPTAPE